MDGNPQTIPLSTFLWKMDKTKYGPYGQTICIASVKDKVMTVFLLSQERNVLRSPDKLPSRLATADSAVPFTGQQGKCGKRSSRSHSLKTHVHPHDIPHVAVDNWPNSFSHFCTHQLGIDSLHKHISEGKLQIMMWFWNTSYIKGKNCQILSALSTEKSKYF